jgi:hypothetical protein
MKDETKLNKLAALFGLQEHVPAKPTPPDPRESEKAVQRSREAEATILYLEEPARFVTRKCGHCDEVFAVDRTNISMCSDTCRTKHLLEKFGIEVDLSKRTPTERWRQGTGGREPLIVPPAVITLLSRYAPAEASA